MGLLDGFRDAVEVELEVHGMACRYCKRAVERAVEGLEAVQSANVLLDEGRARVRVDSGIEAEHLVECIEQAGFDARCAPEAS